MISFLRFIDILHSTGKAIDDQSMTPRSTAKAFVPAQRAALDEPLVVDRKAALDRAPTLESPRLAYAEDPRAAG